MLNRCEYRRAGLTTRKYRGRFVDRHYGIPQALQGIANIGLAALCVVPFSFRQSTRLALFLRLVRSTHGTSAKLSPRLSFGLPVHSPAAQEESLK
jgi:hypothetical protein